MKITIKDFEIGDGAPVFVIAEMAWSHDGDVEKAKSIVSAAAKAKAQAINIHVTSLQDYMIPNYGNEERGKGLVNTKSDIYSFLENISLSQTDWLEIVKYAREESLLVSIMCNDFPSLDFAVRDLNPDILMIHPSCIGDVEFVKKVASVNLPTVLYIGGLTLSEVENTVKQAQAVGNDKLILQHGFQSYPTLIEDNNLSFLGTLKNIFGYPVSFGDHTDGGDLFALVIPSIAVAMGANIIEKHLTHDRSLKGTDYQSALEPTDFSRFVEQIRNTELAIGNGAFPPLNDAQYTYRGLVRKRIVASKALSSGKILTEEDIAFKRAKLGYYPEEMEFLLGRCLKSELSQDEPITKDDIDQV